jgi:putative ABC transport system permease protein
MEVMLVQGILLSGSGMVIGALGAFGIVRPMTNTLFGVAATDPTPFAAVALLIGGAALLACYSAARKTD